jgi:hypothetical protein
MWPAVASSAASSHGALRAAAAVTSQGLTLAALVLLLCLHLCLHLLCRYVHKDYYLQVHRTSAAMAAFKQRLAAVSAQVEISGQSYNKLDIGFML